MAPPKVAFLGRPSSSRSQLNIVSEAGLNDHVRLMSGPMVYITVITEVAMINLYRDEQTEPTCVIGMTGSNGMVELYGLNELREVAVHGWFLHSVAVRMLLERPLCVIAVDHELLAQEDITALRRSGHTLLIAPRRQIRGRSSARDVCQLAASLASNAYSPHAHCLQ